MSKIYQDAKDKNVATIVVYTDDTNVFYDQGKAKKVSFEDLSDYFVKGMLVKTDAGLFAPIAFKTETNTNKVTIYKDSAAVELASDTKVTE